MNWKKLFEKNEFVPFTSYHLVPILVIFTLGIICALIARKAEKQSIKTIIGVLLSLIPFFSMSSSFAFSVYEGFEVKEDLPFHLCRFLSLMAPLVMFYRNRFWLGIFYFWIIVGTLNANITPDIEFGYPHWSYFNYWLQHTGLLVLPIYAILVYDLDIKWRDYINSYLGINLFLLITLAINFYLDSNYMYTLAKPPVESLLDILGPWPWYLISGQLLALGLCFIAYLPFFIAARIRK